MPRSQISVIARLKQRPAAGTNLAPAQAVAPVEPRGPAAGDEAMFKLSRRLWSLEIHRRLALQARRML